jgi:hypothetical protein
MLTVYIEGIGLIGPGFDGWEASRTLLSGQAAYQARPSALPVPAVLPAAERRRCGPVVKLALGIGLEAAAAAEQDPAGLPAVFSASGADGNNCHELCEMLASDDRFISPTRFHNSVHNAAAGYWSIATGAMATSSALCAYDGSFGAGLLEAVTQAATEQTRVLLAAYDTPYPEPLRSKRPISDAFGVGLVLAPQRGPKAIAHITLRLTEEAATRMTAEELEQLRVRIPAARSLPLLQAIAQNRTSTLVLDYLDGCSIAVNATPC